MLVGGMPVTAVAERRRCVRKQPDILMSYVSTLDRSSARISDLNLTIHLLQ